MLKGLIFDFDGLIVDTETVIYETWKRVYEDNEQSLKLVDYKQCVGSDFTQFDPSKELEKRCGKKFDWNKIITNAIPANFHGDLQPENIVISKKIR